MVECETDNTGYIHPMQFYSTIHSTTGEARAVGCCACIYVEARISTVYGEGKEKGTSSCTGLQASAVQYFVFVPVCFNFSSDIVLYLRFLSGFQDSSRTTSSKDSFMLGPRRTGVISLIPHVQCHSGMRSIQEFNHTLSTAHDCPSQ